VHLQDRRPSGPSAEKISVFDDSGPVEPGAIQDFNQAPAFVVQLNLTAESDRIQNSTFSLTISGACAAAGRLAFFRA